MSAAPGTNQPSPFNFAELPIYAQDKILKKMSYDGFSAYVQTGTWAQAVSARNSHFVYPTDVREIVIKNDTVFIGDIKNNDGISFEDCRQIKFSDMEVTVTTKRFTPKTCDFLLSLGEIRTLKCPFLRYEDTSTADFFKKARIQTLKMTSDHKDYGTEGFPFDTSSVDEVEIDSCFWLLFDVINSVKARKKVSLPELLFSSDEVLIYIDKMIESGKVVDLMITWRERMAQEDLEGCHDFLENRCTAVANNKWICKLGEERKPFMMIEMNELSISLKGC